MNGAWDKPLSRGAYALWGLGLMILKYNLDRAVSLFFFGRNWGVLSYLGSGDSLFHLGPQERQFYTALLLIALPFLAAGLWLTLRRLRDAGWPGWLSVIFFLPGFNLLFFLVLCVVPSERRRKDWRKTYPLAPPWTRWVPQNTWGAAALGVLVAALAVVPAVWFGTNFLQNYGWGLFCGLPFLQGMLAALIGSVHGRSSFSRCTTLALLAVVVSGGFILACALEGLICLIMAAPLAAFLAFLGGLAAYCTQWWGWNSGGLARMQCAAWLGLLAVMTAEVEWAPTPAVWPVTTSVSVKAAPEKIWPAVIAFSQIPAPREWIFKMGIAHPIRAKISGCGKGSIRECIFSTGTFVEPITVWDEPRCLAFSVSHQPAPMIELTPYSSLHTPHLDHYLVSHRGQFLLLPQPDGSTILQGTTWYENRMWPQGYWRLWSDYLLHTIHRRVLEHIKTEVETAG